MLVGCVQCPVTDRGTEQLGAGSTSSTRCKSPLSIAGALNSKGLAHDGATAGDNLKVGHGTSSTAGSGRSRGKGSEGRGRSAREVGAHGTRLLQKSLHLEETNDVRRDHNNCRGKESMQVKEKKQIPQVGGGRPLSKRGCQLLDADWRDPTHAASAGTSFPMGTFRIYVWPISEVREVGI